MRIFVINLKRSPSRRRHMVRQLRSLGLDFEFFDAIDGSKVSMETVNKYFDKEFFKNRSQYYSMGAVGCALSHYFLYEKIVAEKIDKCLILEDDMILHKGLGKLLPSIGKEMSDNEIIMLFYHSVEPIHISFSARIGTQQKFNLFDVTNVSRMASTAGYVIGYEAAKEMMRGLLPISTTADDWGIFRERQMFERMRVVYPFLLENSLVTTTISPKLKEGLAIRQVFNFVEDKKIFPFHQLLKMRRKRTFQRIQNVKVID